VTSTLAIDHDDIERRRMERARRLAVLELPVVRLVGSILLSVGVLLHNRYLLHQTSLTPWVDLSIALGAYCALTWLILIAGYRRDPPLDFTVAALAGDMILWTCAIYWTGGEQSWLFFIILMRVGDQTQTSVRRCLSFALFGTLCYVAMLWWIVGIDGRPIVLSVALVKTAFLLISGLYLSLAARTAENRRARLTDAIRTSRELIAKLEEQSIDLRETGMRAEEASAAKSEFVANISHEMRTPLHGILGMLQLAMERAASSEVQRQLDLARRSAESLLSTIDDILDFSKIEARKIELEPVYFDLREAVTEVCKSVGVTAMMKGVDFTFAVESGVPDRVWGDPLRIRQVLINLIGNAIKFTPSGEIVVRVGRVGASPEGEARSATLTLTVTDTGIGIDPIQRELIFDPFAQADSSHSRRFGGTGLGLSIVARLVDAMGGWIHVESEPGRGSAFTVTLPLEYDAVGIPRPAWENGLAGMRVVVIEPRATSRAVIEEILRSHGMVPESYATVAAAMHPPLREAYACVVADGSSLTASGWKPLVPVVLVVTRLAAVEEGAVIVTRPVGELELVDSIGVATGLTDRAVAFTLEPAGGALKSMRVLVVDDHPVNQEFAAAVVRQAGHDVQMAASGEEALALFQEQDFDAVLMDVQMPGIDGLEVTRRFRISHPGAHTRIVGLTAHSSRQDRDRCLDAGMDEVLVKPVSRGRLADALREPILPGVSGALLARVRDAFQKQTPKLIASMRAALERSDTAELARDAHTMKGALSNFGPGDALNAARCIEEAALAGDLMHAADSLTILELAVKEVEERLGA
jgi:signal transduction histidine kinase/DNA-binding response OmpR family regulator